MAGSHIGFEPYNDDVDNEEEGDDNDVNYEAFFGKVPEQAMEKTMQNTVNTEAPNRIRPRMNAPLRTKSQELPLSFGVSGLDSLYGVYSVQGWAPSLTLPG